MDTANDSFGSGTAAAVFFASATTSIVTGGHGSFQLQCTSDGRIQCFSAGRAPQHFGIQSLSVSADAADFRFYTAAFKLWATTVRFWGDHLNCRGISDQHDAAPKASHRSKKQPAAAANAPAGKRAKGKKGKEQTADIVDLSDVPEEKHRAADWTVKETVWVSVSLMLCHSCIVYKGHSCPVLDHAGAMQLLRGLLQVWGAWYKRTGSAKQGTKSDAQKFENDLPLILNQCGPEAGYPAGTPFPRSVNTTSCCMLSAICDGLQALHIADLICECPVLLHTYSNFCAKPTHCYCMLLVQASYLIASQVQESGVRTQGPAVLGKLRQNFRGD